MAEACRARGVNVINKRIEDILTRSKARTCGGVRDHRASVRAAPVVQHVHVCSDRRVARALCRTDRVRHFGAQGDFPAVDAEHVNLFNPQSLSLLVESCGFEVLEVILQAAWMPSSYACDPGRQI